MLPLRFEKSIPLPQTKRTIESRSAHQGVNRQNWDLRKFNTGSERQRTRENRYDDLTTNREWTAEGKRDRNILFVADTTYTLQTLIKSTLIISIYIREHNWMSTDKEKKPIRLAPEVNKIIFVRNLPYKITNEEMYDVFGRFGPIRQIRKGKTGDKKGTAFIVYEDIFDAKDAV